MAHQLAMNTLMDIDLKLIPLYVPLCDVLSASLSLVCYCIKKCMYKISAFSVEKE